MLPSLHVPQPSLTCHIACGDDYESGVDLRLDQQQAGRHQQLGWRERKRKWIQSDEPLRAPLFPWG
jgi:hypothetical protein